MNYQALHIEKASDAVAEGDKLELEVLKVEEEAIVLSKRKIDAVKCMGSTCSEVRKSRNV